jgi:hypothetical protein
MKLVRRIALILVLVVVVIVVGVYVAIDVIARNIIDSQGSSVLGVSTSVESVHLAVFTQSTSLTGLTIANPPGFVRPNFIAIESAEIDANLGTLISDTIDIPLVHITGLTVDLEQINDKMNATEIINNVDRNTASAGDTSEPVSFNVQKLIIENIHLTASGSIVNIAGGHLDTKIPRLELHNLGTKTDGDQLSHQLISLMLGVLMKHIAENPIQGLSGAAVGSLASALENIPLLDGTGAGRKIGDALKRVNRGINTELQDVGDGFKKLGKGLGGIFGHAEAAQPDGKKSDSDGQSKDSDPK